MASDKSIMRKNPTYESGLFSFGRVAGSFRKLFNAATNSGLLDRISYEAIICGL